MARASGYIVQLPTERIPVFLNCIDEGERFAEPVADFQHSRDAPLICFVTSGRMVTHIALGKRGMRAGTGLRRLNFDKAENLQKPISFHRILRLLPNRNRASVEKRFKFGGLLTNKGFAAVVEAVRQLSPQSRSILEKYSTERIRRIDRLSARVRQNLAYQKEAVLTALSIAQLSRETIQDWAPPEGTPISFLEGLPSVRLREDPMVVHDFINLPGYDRIKTYPYNAAVFESDSERLTVIVANRLPLEMQTGTDLIYFNETYKSFVMVQYKAMESEKNGHGGTHAVFRLPNPQLEEEIQRMDALLTNLRGCSANGDHNGFRLTYNPFFLKLCPRLVFKPDDIGLVPGMYLPLDYWKFIENNPGIRGPRGGARVTYQNVGRYFDNTAFMTIVAKAWVGTTPPQSTVLEEVIRQTLETGKAVAIAVKSTIETSRTSPSLLSIDNMDIHE